MTTAFMIGVVGLHLEDLLSDGVILRVDKNELIYAAVIFPVTTVDLWAGFFIK